MLKYLTDSNGFYVYKPTNILRNVQISLQCNYTLQYAKYLKRITGLRIAFFKLNIIKYMRRYLRYMIIWNVGRILPDDTAPLIRRQ
jgi:hypothetical protein